MIDRRALIEEIEQLGGSTLGVYHPEGLAKLSDDALVGKLDILKRLLALANHRRALIESAGLTEDDCVMAAVFGPHTEVEIQIVDISIQMKGLAEIFNKGS